MGGVISAPALSILNGCQPKNQETANDGRLFNNDRKNIISAISALIIPVTDTPGALEANVPDYIQVMITDCYPDEDQERFVTGLDEIDKEAKNSFDKSFLNLEETQQVELLTRLEKEAVEKRKNDPEFVPPALLMLKELTLIGYFTSEVGATQALNYVPVPGKYEGCVPLQPGQKAWAT
jgi:hypothetical protein